MTNCDNVEHMLDVAVCRAERQQRNRSLRVEFQDKVAHKFKEKCQ